MAIYQFSLAYYNKTAIDLVQSRWRAKGYNAITREMKETGHMEQIFGTTAELQSDHNRQKLCEVPENSYKLKRLGNGSIDNIKEALGKAPSVPLWKALLPVTWYTKQDHDQ